MTVFKVKFQTFLARKECMLNQALGDFGFPGVSFLVQCPQPPYSAYGTLVHGRGSYHMLVLRLRMHWGFHQVWHFLPSAMPPTNPLSYAHGTLAYKIYVD